MVMLKLTVRATRAPKKKKKKKKYWDFTQCTITCEEGIPVGTYLIRITLNSMCNEDVLAFSPLSSAIFVWCVPSYASNCWLLTFDSSAITSATVVGRRVMMVRVRGG